MKVFAFACIIFAVCISTSLQRTPFHPCYGGDMLQPTPKSVTVLGCYDRPCEFVEHTNLSAQLDFVAQTNALSLTTEVNVIMESNMVPYPWGTDQQGCKSLSKGKCPLTRGEIATYHINMRLCNFMHQYTPFWYEFKLLDGNNSVQVCFRVYSKFVVYEFSISRLP